MAHYNTLFHQLLQLVPRHHFENIVNKFCGDRYIKSFSCWNQLTTLLYAQVSGKDSLRDIVNGMGVNSSKLYHVGLKKVRRSTLSDANTRRPHKIYEELFYKMLGRCKSITPKHKFKFKNPLYSLDATFIQLCFTSFPWTKYSKTKGAIKLHYGFDHSGNIPDFLVVTNAKKHDSTIIKKNMPIVPDSIYCFDRGYVDYLLFSKLHKAKAFFVTRAKKGMSYRIVGQHTETLKKGILSDEIIMLNNDKYETTLRLIRYYDHETDKLFEFLTNNFKLAPYTITQIYKARWQIEAFFKWIKQNLKIKSFLGTTENAVLTQIWVAMCYYLLLAYIKYQTKYAHSLFYLHRIIKDTLLERFTIIDLLRGAPSKLNKAKSEEFQYAFF